MSQDMQKRVLRGTMVFALVFGLVFGVLRQMANASDRYMATTTLVVLPRNENALETFSRIDTDMAATVTSERFARAVSDARYRETEEWQSFSFDVNHPARGVFVFSYRADAGDPFLAREAIETVRREAFLALAQKYDASRDIEIRFMDVGEVSETPPSQEGLWYAFLVALGTVLVGEGTAFWWATRISVRELQEAVREKVRSSSSVRPWWLAPVSTQVPAEEGLYSLLNAHQEETVRDVFPEPQVVVPVETTQPERDMPKAEKEILAKISSSGMDRCPLPVSGSAPANLTLLTEIPDILKPTWAIRHEREIAENGSAVVAPALEVSAEAQQEESTSKESHENDTLMTDEIVSESPAKNPEPSVEELKARLNALLRGELG